MSLNEKRLSLLAVAALMPEFWSPIALKVYGFVRLLNFGLQGRCPGEGQAWCGNWQAAFEADAWQTRCEIMANRDEQ